MKNSLKFATMLVAAQISISPINIYAAITTGAEGNLDGNGGWTGWNVGDNAGWDDLRDDQTSGSWQIKALKFDDDTLAQATLPTGYDGIIVPGIINTRDDKATLLIQSGSDTAPVKLGPVKDQNNAGLEIKLEDNKHVDLINRYNEKPVIQALTQVILKTAHLTSWVIIQN